MSWPILNLATLQNGEVELFDTSLSSDFLQEGEADLSFPEPVHVCGKAYCTEEDLIVHFSAKTKVVLPCAICNRNISLNLKIIDATCVEPLAEIKNLQFDLRLFLRESLLLEAPQTTECSGGCKEREQLKHYLRPQEKKEDVYFPFANELEE